MKYPYARRVFNVQQEVDAMLGYPAVRRVEYDPSENPTRMVMDGMSEPNSHTHTHRETLSSPSYCQKV